METPVIKIQTDDDMSMQSELKGTICEELKTIDFTYETQMRGDATIRVYPCDIDELIEFLKNAKAYLEE